MNGLRNDPLQERLLQSFMASMASVFSQLAGIEVAPHETAAVGSGGTTLQGVSTLTGFAGEIEGSFVLNMEASVAEEIACTVMAVEKNLIEPDMVTDALLEINNMIVGDAVTELNNSLKWKLRLLPPLILTGKDARLTAPGSLSVHAEGRTEAGMAAFTVSWTEPPAAKL